MPDQIEPVWLICECFPDIIGNAMGAVAAGTGRHRQYAQIPALIFESAGVQAMLQNAYGFADAVIWVYLHILFMTIDTSFTQHVNALF